MKTEQKWEDHPGKYYDSLRRLLTSGGEDPYTLTECKRLCDARPGCVAVDFLYGEMCNWYDTRVPVEKLHTWDWEETGSDLQDQTFSYKIIASGIYHTLAPLFK